MWWMRQLKDGTRWCIVCEYTEHSGHAEDCPIGVEE